MNSSASSGWLFDYGFDISAADAAADADFMITDSPAFSWVLPQTHTFNPPSNISLEEEYSLDSTVRENRPSKRLRTTESNASGSKACREKLRRDKLNERFLELSSILEPGGIPKTDKVALLSDAVRVVTQLRDEAQRLKETNDELQAKVKELKEEKNEIRNEKNRLKLEKENLEQQVKLTNFQPSFLPQTPSAKGQFASQKLIPFIGYPGIAMWQFMSPSAVDTSKDHLLRPPVA